MDSLGNLAARSAFRSALMDANFRFHLATYISGFSSLDETLERLTFASGPLADINLPRSLLNSILRSYLNSEFFSSLAGLLVSALRVDNSLHLQYSQAFPDRPSHLIDIDRIQNYLLHIEFHNNDSINVPASISNICSLNSHLLFYLILRGFSIENVHDANLEAQFNRMIHYLSLDQESISSALMATLNSDLDFFQHDVSVPIMDDDRRDDRRDQLEALYGEEIRHPMFYVLSSSDLPTNLEVVNRLLSNASPGSRLQFFQHNNYDAFNHCLISGYMNVVAFWPTFDQQPNDIDSREVNRALLEADDFYIIRELQDVPDEYAGSVVQIIRRLLVGLDDRFLLNRLTEVRGNNAIPLFVDWMRGDIATSNEILSYFWNLFGQEDRIHIARIVSNDPNLMATISGNPDFIWLDNFIRHRDRVQMCLPRGNHNRRKREPAEECLFTWEDVDEFNEEKDEKRDFSKIRVDGEKFINYIKDLPEVKQNQLIHLADGVQVKGRFQDLVNKLISNQKVMNHLARVGKISGMTMHGMMAKNILADFLNGDYQGVAINVGFIAGGQGFAKVAEAASLKGLKLASEGKLLLGRSLRAASPFLARGTSAFVIYDLVNQVKAFKNGTEGALVGVVGDSIYLGVDAAEIGIEIAEAFEVLEGVSSVTGPIGATVGAVVFVGTDIYMAVKRVDKIDEIIHLTGKERFVEGLRAFIGMEPENHIQELLQEKEVSNELVRQGLEYLKQHNDIQRYVFPTVDNKFKPDLDNKILLDKKRNDIKWSRARPDDTSGGKLFCFPQGNDEAAPNYGSYLCENAIGLSANKTGNHTLVNLGEGKDYAKGFLNNPNIFVVSDGSKEYYGGNNDDIFVLNGNYIKGYLDGGKGIDTLDLTEFAQDAALVKMDLRKNTSHIIYYGQENRSIDPVGLVQDALAISADSNMTNYLVIEQDNLSVFGIERVLGRKGKSDLIHSTCGTDFLDGQGSSKDGFDVLRIENSDCVDRMKIVVRPDTHVENKAYHGEFNYIVLPKEGKAIVNITSLLGGLPTDKHNFFFNSTISDLIGIYIKNVSQIFNYTIKSATFSFLSTSNKSGSEVDSGFDEGRFNITISDIPVNASYALSNGAEIKMGSKGNMYMLENTNKSAEEIIKNYLPIANRLNKMSFFIQSLLSNEAVVIGSGNHEVIHNNPLYKSHLVGNGGENVYVIDFEADNVPEIIIHDIDEENSIDTIDLRNIVKKARSSVELQVIKSENDLLLKATVEKEVGINDEYFTVRLKDGVKRYNKTHVIVENIPMAIRFNNNEWSLKPQPLIFKKDKEIIVVTDQDVEKGSELITSRKGRNYTFVRSNGSDLMITNAFDLTITKDDLCSITLNRFYETPKMETLSIKFADKEIMLKDHQKEISAARDVNIVKKEHKDQVRNDVFNRTKNDSEVMVSNQLRRHRHEHSRQHMRNRRMVISNGTKPSSWINDLFSWVKSSVSGLLSSKPKETSSTSSSISQPVDINGTIMLLDVLVRRVTGQKYISTVYQSISPLEAQGYTLNITEEFEKVLNETAIKSGISATNLNFYPVEVQSAIVGQIISENFSKIPKILYSIAKEACPEFKQTDKFLDHLKSNLEEVLAKQEAMMLQQKVEKPFKVLGQEVLRKGQLSKKPDTFLNGTSVIQGISRAIN